MRYTVELYRPKGRALAGSTVIRDIPTLEEAMLTCARLMDGSQFEPLRSDEVIVQEDTEDARIVFDAMWRIREGEGLWVLANVMGVRPYSP